MVDGVLGEVDRFTGGGAVASMSVRSKSAKATCAYILTLTCASGHFSYNLCCCCGVNDASGRTIFACSGCVGSKVNRAGAFVVGAWFSTLLPCVKGTGASTDMHESPTLPIMLLLDGH